MVLLKWIAKKRIDILGRKERRKKLSHNYEKLRSEINRQDKELANLALKLVKKNEFLVKTIDELQNVTKAAKDEFIIKKINSIISGINREVDQNKQRKVFDLAFDEVHEQFMSRLKSKYPALTPNELRLCAYLKMNISTKEIAPLMNISVRGVEICRYRVRKKLNISRTTNLTSMIINF